MRQKAIFAVIAIGLLLLGALGAQLPALAKDLAFLRMARLAVEYENARQKTVAPTPAAPAPTPPK